MDDQSFDQLLKSALARTPDQLADPHAPKPHPEPDVLQLHHAQELDAAQAKQVQEHIEACASCARLFLDFDAPPPIDPRDENFDVQAGWERLTQTAGIAAATKTRPAGAPRNTPFPMAASLAAAVITGLIGFQLGRQSKTAQPGTPPPSTRLQTVEVKALPGATRSSQSSEPIVEAALNKGVTLLVSLLLPEKPRGQVFYDVKLVPAEHPEQVLRTWTNAGPSEPGGLTVDIPDTAVPPGTYELWVYATGKADALARYGLMLRAP
jgi:hypothetical protein